MHGEYKVPGGKLVVVDVKVTDGRLSSIQLSGDFFLEPETALADITGALAGTRVDASDEEIADRVRDATRHAELLGITPEAVAIALRRAIAGGTQ